MYSRSVGWPGSTAAMMSSEAVESRLDPTMLRACTFTWYVFPVVKPVSV